MNRTLFTCAMLATLLSMPARAQDMPPAAANSVVIDFNTCDKPEYPRESLKLGQAGTVMMSFLVSVDGAVVDSKILRSSGYGHLDKAAQVALKRCKFSPSTRDGKPVQDWMPVQYAWSLEMTAEPDYTSCANPKYPREAWQKRQEGTVTLSFLVGAGGAIRESRVKQSSGFAVLDTTALVALNTCKFKAASVDGKPVESWVDVPYEWSLKRPPRRRAVP